MPRLMDETASITVEVDEDISDVEESTLERRIALDSPVGDLTDGGIINGINVFPTQDGERQQKGRPSTRMAWMWDGTPSELHLGYSSSGKQHDSARPYLQKRL